MIINFADKVTENIFYGRFSPKGLPLTLQRKVHEELLLINGLPNTMFLRSVPSMVLKIFMAAKKDNVVFV